MAYKFFHINGCALLHSPVDIFPLIMYHAITIEMPHTDYLITLLQATPITIRQDTVVRRRIARKSFNNIMGRLIGICDPFGTTRCWVLSWNRQRFHISHRDTWYTECFYYRCILCYFLWTRVAGKKIVSSQTQCQKYCYHWGKQSNSLRYPVSRLKSIINIFSA